MKPLQREEEAAWFAGILQAEGVRSFLEIGSKFGGSLRRFAAALPKGSRVVSVDLPSVKSGSEEHLRRTIEDLKAEGYDAHLIIGDSTAPKTIEKVKALGPFDAAFIDANHTAKYVRADWQNYGPLARIVAFHDIAAVKIKPGLVNIEVKLVWDRIKGDYRHQECCLDGRHNGIGVLWRY